MKIRSFFLALILIVLLEAFIPMGASVILDTELTTITTNVTFAGRIDPMATSLYRENYESDPDNINIILNNILIITNLDAWFLKAGDINYGNNKGNLIKSSVSLQNYLTIGDGEDSEGFELGTITFIEGDKIGEAPIAIVYEQKRSWSGTIDPDNKYIEWIKISFSPSV